MRVCIAGALLSGITAEAAWPTGLPVHNLTPEFIQRVLLKRDVPPAAAESSFELGAKVEEGWKWVKDAVSLGVEKMPSLSTAAPPSSPAAFSVPVKAPTATTLVKEVDVNPDSVAKGEFDQTFQGWEHTVPSWAAMLSKLRCDSMQSFSSCAQHCFTLLPDFANVNRGDDVSREIIPAASSVRKTWLSGFIRKRGNTLPPPHESLFGMTPMDAREYKSCLLNVCVHDYVVNDDIPGCIAPDGTVSTGSNPRKRTDGDTTFNELDFYSPRKADLYHMLGVFTLSRFIQAIIPECNLASAQGCKLRPYNFLNIMFLATMLSISLFAVLSFVPAVRTALPSQPAGACRWTVRQSTAWPVLIGMANSCNTLARFVEHNAARVAHRGTTMFSYERIPPEVELMTKLTRDD